MEAIVASEEALRDLGTTEVLNRLMRYWSGKRGNREFPARKDIDFLEFTYALSWVSLVDVLGDPLRFRYRLVSTGLTNRLGYEMTGKDVDQIPDNAMRGYVTGFYTRAVEARAPLVERSTRLFSNRLWQHEALVLPLSSGDGRIDMLMIYRKTFDPAPLPAWARQDQNLYWG